MTKTAYNIIASRPEPGEVREQIVDGKNKLDALSRWLRRKAQAEWIIEPGPVEIKVQTVMMKWVAGGRWTIVWKEDID